MPEAVTLDAAIDAIMDAVKTRLAQGADLTDVADVVRGDRRSGTPGMPSLWVFGGVATPRNDSSLAERWDLPLTITPVVQNTDPEQGGREATNLAARARSELVRHTGDRRLGLPYVQAMTSTRFEPTAPWHADPKQNLYSAVAVVTVTFTVLETAP